MNMDDTKCPVCWEDYAETGEHVPRLLPCSHTACETCLGELMKKVYLICSECRKRHRAPRKAKSFPQNKYVLKMLKIIEENKSKSNELKGAEQLKSPFQICQEHKRDMSMYCKSNECRIKICQLCLLENHNGHNVRDIIKQRKDKIENRINCLTEQNSRYKEKLLYTKQKMKETGLSSLENLENRKREQMKTFDEMIEKMKNQVTNLEQDIDENILTVEEHIYKLKNIKAKLGPTDNDSEVKDVERLEQSMVESARVYKYFKYNDCNDSLSTKCGHLVEEEEELPKLHITSTFITQGTYSMEVLSNGTVVVFELDEDKDDCENKCQQTHYNVRGNVRFSKKIRENCPLNTVKVKLAEKSCLAMPYQGEQKIVFHNGSDEVVCSYSVAPHDPDRIYTASSDTLMYVDRSTYPREIRWLDCSTNPPKPADGKQIIHTEQGNLTDVCCVRNGDTKLLVAIQDYDTISAYNTETDELEWTVADKLPVMKQQPSFCSVTTDGQGHLFVCDTNNKCIQMFSVTGEYLGAVLREGEQGLGGPWWIRWAQNLSSLVVAHGDDQISVIKPYV